LKIKIFLNNLRWVRKFLSKSKTAFGIEAAVGKPMWFVVLGLALLSLATPAAVADWIKAVAAPTHRLCTAWVQAEGELVPLYAALACGAELPKDWPHLIDLRAAGVIHLFVVSGSHLLFLEQLLRPFPKTKWPGFVTFAFMAGLKPPIFRSLLQHGFYALGHKNDLNWRSSHCVFVSGVVTLTIDPSLWLSLSLQLSWLASLALLLAERLRLNAHAVTYVALIPLLAPLGLASPISILINWISSGLFVFLLFPISLAAAILPKAHLLSDPLWQGYFWALKPLELSPLLISNAETSAQIRWLIIFVVNMAAVLTEPNKLKT